MKASLLLVCMFLSATAVEAQEWTLAEDEFDPVDVCHQSLCETSKGNTPGASEDYFLYLRVEPRVFEKGFVGPFTLTFGVVDSTIQEIEYSNDIMTRKGSRLLTFKDDGTNGDQIAGDFIFTVDSVRTNYGVTSDAVIPVGQTKYTVTAKYASGPDVSFPTTFGSYSSLDMYAYDPAQMPEVTYMQLSDRVTASRHVLSIAHDYTTSQFNSHLQRYYSCAEGFDQSCYVAQLEEIFRYVPNEYDQIVLLHAGKTKSAATHGTISNTVQGIGDRINEYHPYPFASRLDGITNFYSQVYPGFVTHALTHELLHQYRKNFQPWTTGDTRPDLGAQWGYGHWARPLSGKWGMISGKTGFHAWPYYRPTSTEQLTDSTWRINYDWSAEIPHEEYNDVELYTMGLMAPDENPEPFMVFWGQEILEEDLNHTGPGGYGTPTVIKADSAFTVSVEQMIAWDGPRVPSASQQSNSWNVLYYIPFYRVMTKEELAIYEYFILEYEKEHSDVLPATFYEVTRGRGRMTSYISPIGYTGVEEDEQPQDFGIRSVYPNPARAYSTINYRIDSPREVAIAVYDILGREVVRASSSYSASGIREQRLDTSGWSSGVYLIRLTSAGRSDTYPLLVTQ